MPPASALRIGSVFGRIAEQEAAADARKLRRSPTRLMVVCNSCRYCEGLCAVFPAMEMRRAFPDGDLNYLANLCHGCGACYDNCVAAHEFDVNVPKIFAQVRAKFYRAYAWPAALGLFDRNGHRQHRGAERRGVRGRLRRPR